MLMSSSSGAGLAGLVAACELVERGRRVLIVDQENADNIGGQAFWSFGGLFFVDSPEQRRLGIRDSHELALQDWLGTAGFDRPEDHWPRQWAHAYVDFAAGEKRGWLRERGLQIFPVVGWAERGGYDARGHGNSVPRFHITWGTGPGIVDIFARRLRDNAKVRFAHRRRVDELIVEDGAVVGVRGAVLEPSNAARGEASSRNTVGDFELRAQAVIVASGGIGGNHDLVRQNWPKRMGRVPDQLLSGVPAHVDGRMIGITESAGARVINSDRMWHYTEGITNYDPIWPLHGIRIIPGPSSMWLDATGKRLPPPLYPRLRHPRHAGVHRQNRPRLHVVRPERPHHREGVRAVGSGTEPRSDRAQRAPGAAPRQAGRAAAGTGVRRQGRRLRHGELVAGVGIQDECSARRRTTGLRRRGGRGHRPRP